MQSRLLTFLLVFALQYAQGFLVKSKGSFSRDDASSNGEARFIFNPFMKFVPKVYYYQLPVTTAAPVVPSPLARCLARNAKAFFVDGECYLYINTADDYAAADLACANTYSGRLWTPNIYDTRLWEKVVAAATPKNLFKAASNGVWLGIKLTAQLVALGVNGIDYSDNHLIQSALATRDSADNCALLQWANGAFYIQFEDCTIDTWEYVCEI